MIMTKITFTSNFAPFEDFAEFEQFVTLIVGDREIFDEDFPLFLFDKENCIPIEKREWDGNVGWVQMYHKNSLDAKNFQIALIRNKIFTNIVNVLADRKITVKIKMFSSDEVDLNQGFSELRLKSIPSVNFVDRNEY